ncbi:ComEC/Rec2 family competence protein [Candidatus Galacturonibacter soehngenii]|uniref:MBL fold metallo-hydrolase n=1 Tax=Candidatus Galacturonatibacter soehngenii TaxID=2307010 RepID=A0A7V7UI63_9FIRM|nr:ComEC/Rec2 family competence protein [Candidatus Galacturonibacter soehngenii]KAB1440963.1 MBL fold metallo-hydrolase [Candidatus Galacturonibacter soehngenii]
MKRNNRTRKKKQNKLLSSIIISIIIIASTIWSKENIENTNNNSLANDSFAVASMQVHFIDVGQADSILILSDDEAMLVDAGNNEDGTYLVKYLKEQGISKLKYVIATHPHEDHIGGMDDVINNFTVETVLMPDVTHTTKTFEDVLNAMNENDLGITIPSVGEEYEIGKAKFVVIAPNKEMDENNLNDASIGVKLMNGNNRFIMCGDAQKFSEKEMLQSGIDLSAQVYKVSHHGSNTATTDAFLKAISPEYAIIQCGENNSYGHPHKETLHKLEQMGVIVLRNDKNGTIIAISDGNKIQWITEK